MFSGNLSLVYWSQNVGQDFLVLDFFHGRKILKVNGRDGRDPQNREKNAPAGRFTCMLTKLRLSENIHSLLNLDYQRTYIAYSSTKKSWPTFCDQYFWKFPIWNSCAEEKRWEIRMVKVNVIFNDIWLLICLTPLQVNWFMLIN
jgi:hypothetical protein